MRQYLALIVLRTRVFLCAVSVYRIFSCPLSPFKALLGSLRITQALAFTDEHWAQTVLMIKEYKERYESVTFKDVCVSVYERHPDHERNLKCFSRY